MTDILTNPDGSIAVHKGKIVLLDQATQDEMEDCCCEPEPTSPGYELRQCGVICGGNNCNGSLANKYTTPELSPSLSQLANGTVVKIAGSDACWIVYFTSSATGTDVVSVTVTYADCEECCGDDCYICDECEFPLDGTGMSVTYLESGYTCYYVNEDYSGLIWIAAYKKYGIRYWDSLAGGTNYPCSPIFLGGTGTLVSHQGHVSAGNGCHEYPLEAPCNTSEYSDTESIRYLCLEGAGKWSKGPSGGGVDDGTYGVDYTKKYVSDCDGGTVTGEYYRSYSTSQATYLCGGTRYYKSSYKWTQKTFTLSGNDCGNPLP